MSTETETRSPNLEGSGTWRDTFAEPRVTTAELQEHLERVRRLSAERRAKRIGEWREPAFVAPDAPPDLDIDPDRRWWDR
jgi:hypothetical protein